MCEHKTVFRYHFICLGLCNIEVNWVVFYLSYDVFHFITKRVNFWVLNTCQSLGSDMSHL